uniref:Probable acyltransferase n=1 Tax=Candidatus Kentrum sp. DK TaxID=2126562 RepID=A0A450SCU1_9GAMM|nr:MAG: homoserine O-acetyltransferase [Candidatus Kentron sp. DK]
MKILNTSILGASLLAAIATAFGNPAFAYEGIVTKQTFTMPSYTTIGGETISDVQVGWESYGTLNAAKDNVVLVPHHFSATSHVAGRYDISDGAYGYWDSIIGSGKAIDTDKYFVISSDTLVNMQPKNPTVVTTGPATINPATGVPYGMSFPLVTIRDFVNVQKALLDSLGITSLHAVAGVSMGAMQAIEWASAYPKMVKRVIPVAAHGEGNSYWIALTNLWMLPIKLDPNWNNGDYYSSTLPTDGLRDAFKMILVTAWNWKWADESFGRDWAVADEDPAAAFGNQYEIEAWLDATATALGTYADANHFLYLAKACQNFVAGHGGSLEAGLAAIESPVLLIYSPDDLLFPADHVWRTKTLIEADGNPKKVGMVELSGIQGHADGVYSISQAADRIEDFLNSDDGGRHHGPRRRSR